MIIYFKLQFDRDVGGLKSGAGIESASPGVVFGGVLRYDPERHPCWRW